MYRLNLYDCFLEGRRDVCLWLYMNDRRGCVMIELILLINKVNENQKQINLILT